MDKKLFKITMDLMTCIVSAIATGARIIVFDHKIKISCLMKPINEITNLTGLDELNNWVEHFQLAK